VHVLAQTTKCASTPALALADATDAAALGPAPQGAPRQGGWRGCLFLPDTPCAREL